VIQADVSSLPAKLVTGRQRFGKRFACHEAAGKAIFHTSARNGVSYAALA
jgi:hypothetical protein